ncbi:arabinan endo-1,5-alpha-L-arabinosidase [Pseudoduganella umbonata]|uniref:Extracellular exo-alpha-(1->5)-L-arabinofuranosidase n=1 Tax=Pseudoduganella umbonata TaxID=864828 RepID=A0A4P8HLR0_9BURK|nr:arabinan endo-1,5-alpha-L-arabinosidase [Pseudoduganella umbonata]MBB3221560.1 arabinan endo-1,5-alpha-L-arabinosidase [Pseudoduganella umbonata]QCP10699.1 arabinan endo-1,5-alpha-L-arabinosidase [Pseudoduganella umbonata]
MKFQSYLVAASLFMGAAGAQATQVGVHDPVMAKDGNTYYVFSTGPGITFYSSKDMKNWRPEGRVFDKDPVWAKKAAPSFDGHIWAPDIVQRDGKFYLYYSVSGFGKNTSGMGVTVNKTLDPRSPDYKWEDQGMVIQSVPGRDLWNAIDPAVIADEQGNGWMSFGSFWTGLKLFKLNADWTKPAEPQEWYTIARRERPAFEPDESAAPAEIEAPFIFRKNGYYYLFASWGLCCKKEQSTYHVVVGRSKAITGPYLDKDGKDMAKGGGSLVIKGNRDWVGLGHNSAYTFDGRDVLVLHAYETGDDYRQKLKVLDMKWDGAGWPVVDAAQLNSYQSVLLPAGK